MHNSSHGMHEAIHKWTPGLHCRHAHANQTESKSHNLHSMLVSLDCILWSFFSSKCICYSEPYEGLLSAAAWGHFWGKPEGGPGTSRCYGNQQRQSPWQQSHSALSSLALSSPIHHATRVRIPKLNECGHVCLWIPNRIATLINSRLNVFIYEERAVCQL